MYFKLEDESKLRNDSFFSVLLQFIGNFFFGVFNIFWVLHSF